MPLNEMKNWEDIIKDSLEGYESPLPEGSLEDFRARRSGSKKVFGRKALWLVPAVAAACLAVLFIPGRPGTQQEGIQLVEPVTVADASTVDVPEVTTEEVQATYVVPETDESIETVIAPESRNYIADNILEDLPESQDVPSEAPETIEVPETINDSSDESAEEPCDIKTTTPKTSTVPHYQEPVKIKTGIKIRPAVAGVLGTGLVGTAVSYIPLFAKQSDDVVLGLPNDYIISSNYQGDKGDKGDKPFSNDITSTPKPWNGMGSDLQENPEYQQGSSEEPLLPMRGRMEHSKPFRFGISANLPLAEKWNLITGLNYSRYTSKYYYEGSQTFKQVVQYVGIPVRLDWTIASTDSGLLGVYAGAGFEGDWCVAATLDGNKIKKDGLGLSLLGAGGVQLNFTKRAGFYLEPELSWAIPSKNRTLETYRSEHPLMFSINTGLRINLGR